MPEIVFRARKASVHPVAQLRADGEETTEVGRGNPADSPSRRRENDQTAAKAWQVSRAQPHSYSRTLRGKKSAPHAPHLTVGPFDPELIRPVDWLAVPVYSRVSFAGSSGTSDLFRQRAPSVGAPGAILWPRHYRANTSKG